MQITIAQVSDIPQLCELLNSLFAQEIEFVADSDAQTRGLTRIISNPDIGTIFVARQGDRLIGMVSLLYTVSTALGERVALLEDMMVLAEARGLGVGSRLIEHAIEHARRQSCRRITLLTDRDNLSAQRFYRKHGFSLSAMIPLRLNLNG